MNCCVLGFDPGIKISGYGLVERDQKNRLIPIDYGIITNSSEDYFPVYLEKIYNELTNIVGRFKPDSFAIEEPFLAKNPSIALKVGQVVGVVTLVGIKRGLKIFTYSTLQVKQAIVGYGRAEKSQVQEMARMLLSLKEKLHPDDIADALGVAICCLQCIDWEDKVKRAET